MPTILSLKQQPGLLPSNPGEADISPSSFGKAQEALARAGGVAADLGNQYVEKRAIAEENDAILNQTLENSRSIEEKKNAIRQDYMVDDGSGVMRFDPRGAPQKDPVTGDITYPESYSRRMEKVVVDQYNFGKEAMPSQRARLRYQQSADGMVMRESTEALNFEQVELSRYIIQNKDKYETESAQQVRINPSLDNLTEKVANMTKYFNDNQGALYDPAKAASEHNKSVKNIIKEGFFEGMLDKSPNQGLAILNSIGQPSRNPAVEGKIESGVFGKGGSVKEMAKFLDANDINNLRDRFEAKIKEKNMIEAHQINNQLSDMKSAAFSGINPGSLQKGSALIERQAALGVFKTPEDKVRAYSDMISSVVIGQSKSKMAGMTNEEIQASIGDAEKLYHSEVQKVANREGVKIPPEFAAADMVDVKNKIAGTVNQVLKERQSDPASSVLDGNDTLKKTYEAAQGGLGAAKEINEAYYAQSIAEQKRLGVVNPRPLPAQSAKAIAGQISSMDPVRSVQEIDNLKQKTGKYFPQVMNQILKDGKLPEYYATASYVDDPIAGRAIIDGMRNKGTFEKVLADSGTGYKKKDILNAVNQEFDPYYKSMVSTGISGDNNRIASAIREAAYFETANLISRGVPVDQASQKAVDTIIRNKYDVYKGAMLPKQNGEMIKAAMDSVSTEDWIMHNFQEMYLPADKGMEKQNMTSGEYLSFLSEKKNRVSMALKDDNGHTWINKDDGSGAVLNFRVRNQQNPLGYDLIPVRSNNGKNFEINWNDSKIRVGE